MLTPTLTRYVETWGLMSLLSALPAHRPALIGRSFYAKDQY